MTRHVLTLVVALLAAACIDERCDDGTHFEMGLCFPDIPDARVIDGSDGGAPDGGAQVSVPFNTTCVDTAECGGVTNFCAVQPGQTVGFCTHTGCLEDPSVCPGGASCLDLAAYGAVGLSICIGGGS